jgi:hypothetical protein
LTAPGRSRCRFTAPARFGQELARHV